MLARKIPAFRLELVHYKDAIKSYDTIIAMYFETTLFDVNVRPIKLKNQIKDSLYYTISWKKRPELNNKRISDFIQDNYKFRVNTLTNQQKDFLKANGIEKYISCGN